MESAGTIFHIEAVVYLQPRVRESMNTGHEISNVCFGPNLANGTRSTDVGFSVLTPQYQTVPSRPQISRRVKLIFG